MYLGAAANEFAFTLVIVGTPQAPVVVAWSHLDIVEYFGDIVPDWSGFNIVLETAGHGGLVNFAAAPVLRAHVPTVETVDLAPRFASSRGSNTMRPAMPRFIVPSKSSGSGAGVWMGGAPSPGARRSKQLEQAEQALVELVIVEVLPVIEQPVCV